ncbi:MAG: hypothetical protein J6Q17_02345, partial [Clostridia bacterium]|nr:hypothetical protein [Clostridia bacterium]
RRKKEGLKDKRFNPKKIRKALPRRPKKTEAHRKRLPPFLRFQEQMRQPLWITLAGPLSLPGS